MDKLDFEGDQNICLSINYSCHDLNLCTCTLAFEDGVDFVMVLLRARRTKLVPPFGPVIESEDTSSAQNQAQVRARQENRRRSALYAVSSSSGKQLPSVSLQPADARVRRDLLRITQQQDRRLESEKKSAYEDEQNDCKHREHLNFRPPMDHICALQDLHTTVAKDCRGRVKLSADQRIFAKLKQKLGTKQSGISDDLKAEWRLGYSNNVDTGSRAGVGGTFEPRDGIRERVLDTRSAPALLPDSVAIAYPVKESTVVATELVWREEEGPESIAQNNDADHLTCVVKKKKKPWCPASSITSEFTLNSPEQEGADSVGLGDDRLQRFPLRSVEAFELMGETDEKFAVDARAARRQETLMAKVVDTYSRVRARMDRLKDPHLRYELPVEDDSHHPRAYRLGLSDAPSTKPKKGKEKPKFRPKSAGTSVGFQTGALRSKAGNLLTPDRNAGGKVAGARRRPHSANITFFKHSTVYCMASPTPSKSNCLSVANDFKGVVALECVRRQRERDAVLGKLATRGLLHSIPLAQVFARLRREGLLNRDRQLQRGVFERMTLDEYMSACGCLDTKDTSPLTAPRKALESPRASPIKEIKRFCANLNYAEVVDSGTTPSVDMSPSLLATRNALAVSRQQFHLALEAFNLSPTDVNLFFSALDLTVSDRVQVWDAMCIVERLQHEHAALRRARVQQLQAPPAKDLDFFRRHSTKNINNN